MADKDPIGDDVLAYLARHERKEILRFLTCGSVDDGKSTLIGRLLHDSRLIYEDQLAALKRDSKTSGSAGDDMDLALLVDGLQAEREQGITIDVAYRYFSTDRRKFIIADTPGHEQYTRNMVTGASNCDVAVILIDAAHGVLTQTKRHTFLARLVGIRHLVVAVNKMDTVGYDEAVFDAICRDYDAFASRLAVDDLTFVPDLGEARGQRRCAVAEHALVPGRVADAPARARPRGDRPRLPELPHAGAAREPARRVLPGLQRNGGERRRPPGRPRARAAVGVGDDGGSHRDHGRRSRRGVRPLGGHADPRRRDRRRPGRCPFRHGPAGAHLGHVRRDARVAGGGAHGARAPVHREARDAAGVRPRTDPAPPHRRQHARAGPGAGAGTQRDRPGAPGARGAGRPRPLRRQPWHGRLHRHRPHHQRHRRRRHDR